MSIYTVSIHSNLFITLHKYSYVSDHISPKLHYFWDDFSILATLPTRVCYSRMHMSTLTINPLTLLSPSHSPYTPFLPMSTLCSMTYLTSIPCVLTLSCYVSRSTFRPSEIPSLTPAPIRDLGLLLPSPIYACPALCALEHILAPSQRAPLSLLACFT